MAFIDERMHGEIAGRLSMDVSEFKHTFKICITQGLKCVTQILGTSIHLVYISPSLTGTLVATMPLLYFGLNFYGSFLRKLSKKAKESDSEANGIASEVSHAFWRNKYNS